MSKITKLLPLSTLFLLIPLLTACPESDGDASNDGRVQIALSQVHPEHDDHDDEHDDDHEHEDEHGDEHEEDCHDDEHDEEHEESEGEHEEGEHDEEHEDAECEHAEDEHGDEHDEDAHDHDEGEEHDEHEHGMELEDAEGHGVELHAAYVVLDQFQLIECSSLASVIHRSLQGLIGQAFAAGGHDHGHGHGGSDRPDVPDDQRNLNRPHVINLTSEGDDDHGDEEHDDHDHSESPLLLGNARISEGRYCGLRVSIVPAADDAFGLPEGLSLIGTGFYFDWEQDIDGEVSDRVVDSSGIALPFTMTLDLEEPLVIDANTHHVVIGLHLAHLFEDVDLSTATDAEMPAALLEGLEHALEIIDQGEGELE